ncbi:MAG: dihydrodipicolinate synthase family protein [Clostridiales bacterium]|nr:dihydrodipicolinate synthase family protein [Clostridiales bacterium]MBT9259918.1 dihydrodipicolinate synthase family protein [Clostridiales bacterium]
MRLPEGVYPILPTPFTQDGSLDRESIPRLAAYATSHGEAGLAILGVMGEGQKLTAEERREAIALFRAALPEGKELVVGLSAPANRVAAELAKEAEALGATALMVGPPPVQKDEAILAYYQEVARATSLPLVIHDYPASTGITLTPSLLAKMAADIPSVAAVKLEEAPTVEKMEALKKLSSLAVFGALGGLFAFEELKAGAAGIMTGFSYPGLLVKLFHLAREGLWEEADDLFHLMVPLIRFEFQGALGISLRKHLLVWEGVIRYPIVRAPATLPSAATLERLRALRDRLQAQGILSD